MSSTVPYWHVDAFADRAFTGNQAAVMILPAWPDDATLAAIGAENMFAETAFLVKDDSGKADWELRWFTPTQEIRLCGHATLASGHALLGREPDLGEVRFATRKAGILTVRREGSGYAVALPAIPVEPAALPAALAALGGPPPLGVWRNPDHYNLFLYRDVEEVLGLTPDMRGLGVLGQDSFTCTAPGFGHDSGADVVSRVFVPGAGVDEDSVTGSAHAVLTPFWAERLGRPAFTAYQASARGGHLACRLDGAVAWLGGDCVTVVEGSFSF